MPKFKFAKLIRDKIVDNQIASGAKPHYRKLDLDEHRRELIRKIKEEAAEITDASPDKIAEEIADVRQAIDDLAGTYSITSRDIAEAQKLKAEKAGAFKLGIYEEYVEVEEGDPWIEYYRKNSERYPEIE
jgi:predicted house-cleaning noncanonical NTP pyrophosphatase (MazG superfamily)